jgi:hypothetical protein
MSHTYTNLLTHAIFSTREIRVPDPLNPPDASLSSDTVDRIGAYARRVNMWKCFRRASLWLTFIAILPTVAVKAQQVPEAGRAPVPPAIFTAKKVFVSNAGADSGLFPHPFSGDPDRPYNQFYAAIQGWGRYELVADPQDADLVFELQLTGPNGPTNPSKMAGASDPLPMFRLIIFDRKTHYILWALTESIGPAALQKTHDRNFDEALTALTLDLKTLTTQTPAGTP